MKNKPNLIIDILREVSLINLNGDHFKTVYIHGQAESFCTPPEGKLQSIGSYCAHTNSARTILNSLWAHVIPGIRPITMGKKDKSYENEPGKNYPTVFVQRKQSHYMNGLG